MTREEILENMPQSKCEDIVKAFQFGVGFGFAKRYDEMDTLIEDIKKAITPKPKIGHWINTDEGFSPYQCSECKIVEFKKSKYCPNCGAKMEEV